MKLFNLLAGAITLTASVLSTPVVSEGTPQILKFNADYTIKEHPDAAATDIVELYNGESITLSYTVSNDDDVQISVIGVGGAFRDPKTNDITTNITAGSVGPIVLEPGQSQVFSQAINLNLVADSYVLTPVIYISFNEEFMTVQPRMQLATVSDYPISLFNPQLLFLELLLLATFGGIVYFLYETFGKAYLKGTAPVTKKNEKSPSALATATGAKGFDSSWIPEGHIKKTKKAY